MRIVKAGLITLILAGCAPFQRASGPLEGGHPYRSAKLETPTLNGSGDLDDEALDEDSSAMESYPAPSPRGTAHKPNHAFSLTWPLNQIKINQPFRPMKKRRPHLGVDLAGTRGTAIFAAHEGRVIYAGRAFKGFGRMVIVEYDDQWASLYAHLDRIQVKQGQMVEQGQTVGTMGRTGRATGVHLHFELLHNMRPVDPIPLLNEFDRVVEVPAPAKRRPASQL